jgi:simple sugar transport system substrate-binding protein
MRDTFTEEKGYRLIIKDGQQKRENQIEAINEFVAQKVDYIVLAPVTEDGWDEALKNAKDAGIPVIIVDRMIKTANSGLYTCWVGSDFRKEGGTAVAWMAQRFADEEIIIAHMQGSVGSSAQIGRTEGLQSGVDANLGWNVAVRESAEFTEVKGKEVMARFLRQLDHIDVLYCENDNMAFGAIAAIEEAERTYGVGGEIAIISFDATRKGLELTLAGKINYTVECNPLHGERVEDLIQMLERGETPGKQAFVPETAFDAETITQADIDARAY